MAEQKNPNCIVTWDTHTPDRHLLICVMRIFTICSTFDSVTTDRAVSTETRRLPVVSRRKHWNGTFGFPEGQRISSLKCNQKGTGHCESVNIQILLKKAFTSDQVPPRGVKNMSWKITQNRNIIYGYLCTTLLCPSYTLFGIIEGHEYLSECDLRAGKFCPLTYCGNVYYKILRLST